MPPEKKEEKAEKPSETFSTDFNEVSVNYQGKSIIVAWPSEAAKAAGVVPCEMGHPNVPDPMSGKISCGCGSTEKGEE